MRVYELTAEDRRMMESFIIRSEAIRKRVIEMSVFKSEAELDAMRAKWRDAILNAEDQLQLIDVAIRLKHLLKRSKHSI